MHKTADKIPLALEGGKPVRKKPWPSYTHGYTTITKSQLKTAQQALNKRRLFRYDDRPYGETATGKYEQSLCKHFDSKYALALSSCTTAIATALLSLDLPPNSLIACSSFTFGATPSAIILAGHKPLLINTTEELHFDLEDLRARYSPDIKALVVVHMRGMGSDMPAIMEFAKEKQLYVVEDCAAICGLELHGKKLGTFGDISAFSTQSDKFINTGEGGFIITNDELLFQKALVYSGAYVPCFYKHFDSPPEPKELPYQYPLYSFRFDEIRSAIALPQVKVINKTLAQQQKIYHQITGLLAHIKEIHIRQPITKNCVIGNKLVFRIPDISAEKATWFAHALTAEGVTAYALGNPHHGNQRAFWNWQFLPGHKTREELIAQAPKSYTYISECIDIPLFNRLTKKDINDLVTAIKKVILHL
ncbi:MAG: DegT/DnrJ/EryC1/StrS family aminotransferase [Gammaproteobacteria bacterium]|nr:DegT/DnrJ/EryC1/StrS family aminotransferase [Gammaproteobacteria bacterium]